MTVTRRKAMWFAAAAAGLTLAMGGCSSAPASSDDDPGTTEEALHDGEHRESPSTLVDSDVIPVGDSPIYGNPDAPITIVEFTSMQCPHCARAGGTLEELVERYPDTVRVVFKHFPLSMQQQAKPASVAVAAAAQQGMAFEMKSALFDHIRTYRDQPLEDLGAQLAEELGMDVDQFRHDYNDLAIVARVDADMQLGAELGVRGTPHFFINGEVVNGAQPLESFAATVDEQLRLVNELEAQGVDDEQIYAAAVEENFAAPGAQPTPQAPEPEPVAVHMVDIHDSDPIKGASAEDALVTILEFSSFQCPFCARGSETLKQLVEKYPNQVRVVFKHFPLAFQQQSEPASRAAVAAGNQGEFWAMYDHLYDNQRSFGEDGLFERIAEEIGLDLEQFRMDFEASETASIVEKTQKEGRSAGIRGTPGFLINGIQITGAQPLPVFEDHVKEQIEIAEKIGAEEGLSGNELYASLVAYNKEHSGDTDVAAPSQDNAPPAPPEEPELLDDDALSVGDSHVKGADDAAITIYEFSSFQCPFCARAAGTIEQILDEYDGDIRLVYKNFPLPFQEHSEPAARAAIAAGEQGKFWEMHEVLYENQRSLGQENLFEGLAEEIGIDDIDQFRADFASEAVAERVAAEQQEGQSVGVRGTPAFFINGEMLSGAQPVERFKEVIDRHLNE